MVLAMAFLAAPVVAQGFDGASMGATGVDIVGDGIFETEGGACRFPTNHDTNFDSVEVGNDMARAFGGSDFFGPKAKANNFLEIKKNQDSGECASCCTAETPCQECKDACIKVNLEQITVGDRSAFAYGDAEATNRVKIVTNQQ